MSKSIENAGTNKVTIVGTLLNASVRDGVSKASNKPYRSGTITVRVNQVYNGKEEVSEVPVSFIAMKYKNDGTTINPAYENVQQFTDTFKTAENYGSEATRIRIGGAASKYGGTLEENMYVSKQNPEQVISAMRISGRFFNEVKGEMADCATFSMDIFIIKI